jgi:hypothetical protein
VRNANIKHTDQNRYSLENKTEREEE